MDGFNIHTLPALLDDLPHGQRVIGIDPGSRRIGLALSDVERRLASPYGTLTRAALATNAAEIGAIARAQGAGGLVIGYPLDDNGQMGRAAQGVRDWSRAIVAAIGLPAALWDETMTTVEAEAALLSADLSRQRRAALIDRSAATHMLQSALDAHLRSQGR